MGQEPMHEPQTASAGVVVSPSHQRGVIELIPTLRSYARYWARNQVDADDLVQDTLLRVFQYAANFQVGTNLRAWLFSILRNKFYSNTVKSMREPVGG